MQTNNGQEGICKRNSKRLAAALLAACLTISMSTSAFAAIGSNGQSVQPSVHAERPIHHTDGSKLIMNEDIYSTPVPPSLASIAEGYGGTIYVGVGETVTLHVGQRGVALFGIEGYQKIHWAKTGTRKATVSYSTNLSGLSTDQYMANMKKYEAKNDSSGTSATYCVELYLQGNQPGVEYFAFVDGSGLAGSFYKVVVLGEGEKAPEDTTTGKGSSTGKGGSSSGSSTGTGTGGNGAIADDPRNPQTVLPHLIVS